MSHLGGYPMGMDPMMHEPMYRGDMAPSAMMGGGGSGTGEGPLGDSVILEESFDPHYVPTEDEVREYAEFLGIGEKDKDLWWIAREGLKAPLPEPWKPCKTADNQVYYFNFQTGESKWEHPCDEYYKNLYQEELAKKARRATTSGNDRGRHNSEDSGGGAHQSSTRDREKKRKSKKKKKSVPQLGGGGNGSSGGGSLSGLNPLGGSRSNKRGGLGPVSLGSLSMPGKKPLNSLDKPVLGGGSSGGGGAPTRSWDDEASGHSEEYSAGPVVQAKRRMPVSDKLGASNHQSAAEDDSATRRAYERARQESFDQWKEQQEARFSAQMKRIELDHQQSLDGKKSSLQADIDAFEADKQREEQRIQRERDALQRDLEAAREQRDAQEEELRRLKDRHDDQRRTEERRLTEERERWAEDEKRLRDDIAESRERYRRERDEWKRKLDNNVRDEERLSTRSAELQEELDRIEKDFAEQRTAAERKHSEWERDQEHKKREISQAIDDLKKELQSARDRHSVELRDLRASQEAEMEQMRNAHAEATEESMSAVEKQREATRQRERAADRETIRSLQRELDFANEQNRIKVMQLQQQLENASAAGSSDQPDSSNAELLQQVDDLRNQVQARDKELADSRRQAHADAAEHRLQILELNDQLKAATAANSDGDSNAAAQAAWSMKLQQGELEEVRRAAEVEKAALESQVQDLQARLDAAVAKSLKAEQDAATARNKLKLAEANNRLLEETNATLEAENQARADVGVSDEEKNQLSDRIQLLQKQVDDFRSRAESTMADNKRLQESLTFSQSQATNLQQQLDEARRSLQQGQASSVSVPAASTPGGSMTAPPSAAAGAAGAAGVSSAPPNSVSGPFTAPQNASNHPWAAATNGYQPGFQQQQQQQQPQQGGWMTSPPPPHAYHYQAVAPQPSALIPHPQQQQQVQRHNGELSAWLDRIRAEKEIIGQVKSYLTQQRDIVRKMQRSLQSDQDQWKHEKSEFMLRFDRSGAGGDDEMGASGSGLTEAEKEDRRSQFAVLKQRKKELDSSARSLNDDVRQLRSIQQWISRKEKKLLQVEDHIVPAHAEAAVAAAHAQAYAHAQVIAAQENKIPMSSANNYVPVRFGSGHGTLDRLWRSYAEEASGPQPRSGTRGMLSPMNGGSSLDNIGSNHASSLKGFGGDVSQPDIESRLSTMQKMLRRWARQQDHLREPINNQYSWLQKFSAKLSAARMRSQMMNAGIPSAGGGGAPDAGGAAVALGGGKNLMLTQQRDAQNPNEVIIRLSVQ